MRVFECLDGADGIKGTGAASTCTIEGRLCAVADQRSAMRVFECLGGAEGIKGTGAASTCTTEGRLCGYRLGTACVDTASGRVHVRHHRGSDMTTVTVEDCRLSTVFLVNSTRQPSHGRGWLRIQSRATDGVRTIPWTIEFSVMIFEKMPRLEVVHGVNFIVQ
eukprot:COSAG02_NODE_2760_length_8077_cov_2.993106_1_plen_163_part_00